jgi:hypothetical protein
MGLGQSMTQGAISMLNSLVFYVIKSGDGLLLDQNLRFIFKVSYFLCLLEKLITLSGVSQKQVCTLVLKRGSKSGLSSRWLAGGK